MIALCALLLLTAAAFAFSGARIASARVAHAHRLTVERDIKQKAVHADAKRLHYNAQTIHKDATDALLEVRQLIQRHEQTAIEVETLLRKAEQIMNDPRVQYALTHTHG